MGERGGGALIQAWALIRLKGSEGGVYSSMGIYSNIGMGTCSVKYGKWQIHNL